MLDSLPIIRSTSHVVSPSKCRSPEPVGDAKRAVLAGVGRGRGPDPVGQRRAIGDERPIDVFPPPRPRRTPCRCPPTTTRGAATAATRTGRRAPRRRPRIILSVMGTRTDGHRGGLRVALRTRFGRRAVSGPSSRRRRPASRRSRSRRGRWRGRPRDRRPPRGRRIAPAASARESTAGGRRPRAVPR